MVCQVRLVDRETKPKIYSHPYFIFSIFLAKDMTKFYRTYAKLIANKDPKRKDVGIGPQFWKQIEDKTAEKEIKMKNDEKKE